MRKKRIPPYANKLFPIMIFVATFFMSIGYASINLITMNINGEVIAKTQAGIYIADVEYIETSSSLPNENANILYADNTVLKSSINLEPNDLTSEVSLKVSFYNSTGDDYVFKDVVYAEELANEIDDVYSNFNILYIFTNQNEIITKNGGTLDVIITFKYDEINESTSNSLNCILNFEFNKIFDVTYNGISDTVGLPTYVEENDTFELDLSSFNYYYFSIFMGENKLVLNQDYTFENRILKIFNVDNELRIGTFGAVTNGLITLANQYTNTSNIYGDFKILSADTDLSNSLGSCTYNECYSDNNGNFEYDGDGGLVFDSDNQIGILNIDDSMKIEDEFTVYVTLKADVNQVETKGKYSTAVIAMSENGSPYLIWVGFYKGYLHIYSFKKGNMSEINYSLVEEGFLSMNATEYSNKIVNIQIAASKGNITKLYINGNLVKSFNSGDVAINYSLATLGDLRPGRGLKFEGVIYDVALYNKALTSEEIKVNWEYAKEIWNIE